MRGDLSWRRVLVLPLLLFTSPTLSFFLLRASGSLAPLAVYALLVALLALLAALHRVRRAAVIATGALLIAGAVVVYASLDITPASAFLAWFHLVHGGEAGGTISYMFSLFFAFFSALAAAILLIGNPRLAACVYLFVHAFLVAVILESTPLGLVAAAALLLVIVVQTHRYLHSIGLTSVLAVLQIAVTAGLLSTALLPLSVHNPIVDALFSARLQGQVARLFPGFPFLYNVPGYGHSFPQAERGGPPLLTSRPVFRVTASPGETIYLRTAVYDTYGPSGWELSPVALAAAKKAADRSLRVESGPFPRLPPRDQMRVKVLIDFYAALPAPLDASAVQPLSGKLPGLSYGSEAAGYLLSSPVTAGFVFVENRLPGGAPRRSFRGEGNRTRSNDLQTPDLPERVRRLAAELKRPTPAETIASIRGYLASHYTYNLDIEPFRSGTNPVADFLFGSHQGYCVQFATALALLARLDGVPTRYVTGFLVNIPERSSTATVTGLSSHAWVEALLPQQGWTTVEATPPMMRSAAGEPGYYRRFNPSGSQFTERQLLAMMESRVPPPPRTEAPRAPFPLLPAAAGLAGLLLLLFLVRTLRLALMPPAARLRRLSRLVVRRSAAVGAPAPGSVGWRRWAELTGSAAGRTEPLYRAADIALRSFFGSGTVSRRDLRYLVLVRRLLRSGHPLRRGPLHGEGHSVHFDVRSSRRGQSDPL